ncbi:hypothetical protein BDQ17DRAFT_1249501 [Cyathus striatus]|nr:hypothetical protein BDQ17DRAFT_1249501 [Cyathus striatus]
MRHPDFYRRQAETQAKIILHIMASQLVHCHNLNPYNIWTTLSNIHSFHGCFTIISLCCHFYCICLKHSKTMPAYISCICHLSFLLKETGVQVNDDEYIITITAGLPHSYNSF